MNLRKDHFRNLPSRTTGEPVKNTGGIGALCPGPLFGRGGCIPRIARRCTVAAFSAAQTNPGANRAKEHLTNWHSPPAPEMVCGRGVRRILSYMSKRLSATDISALASMKNVAKCDTWCELQNPVNHRVFERKLRPKPLGRGHVCLGVTQRCPPNLRLGREEGADAGLPCATVRGWPKRGSPATSAAAIGGCQTLGSPLRVRIAVAAPQRPQCVADAASPTRPQVRRGYPLSLSISISGGKETYKDSPSNGERTGNSPG